MSRLPRRGRHRLPNTTYGRPPDTGGCFHIRAAVGCERERTCGGTLQLVRASNLSQRYPDLNHALSHTLPRQTNNLANTSSACPLKTPPRSKTWEKSRRTQVTTCTTTLLVADPPTALAVTAEAASCAARAVPSEGMQTTRTARRVPTDRVPDGVPGAGRKPSAAPMTNASNAARESCNACAAYPV